MHPLGIVCQIEQYHALLVVVLSSSSRHSGLLAAVHHRIRSLLPFSSTHGCPAVTRVNRDRRPSGRAREAEQASWKARRRLPRSLWFRDCRQSGIRTTSSHLLHHAAGANIGHFSCCFGDSCRHTPATHQAGPYTGRTQIDETACQVIAQMCFVGLRALA